MDLGWTIGFDRPWLLLLLLALPPMIYLSLTSLAGLGPWRKMFAILLRCLCVGLIVCSLAQMKWQRKTDQLTVLYLLDQSASITPANRKLMLDYAFRQVEQHRREKDKAGVIVFGTEARIESAPRRDRLRRERERGRRLGGGSGNGRRRHRNRCRAR